ncbi:TetR family transcriptional regulator [Variovorax paradoxus]|nr:TetR/AcrR family transcriptional regulator [Variovorax paradoxus]MBT2304860.1 TetR family transcriptional regulator [Variovorax paradoxus]
MRAKAKSQPSPAKRPVRARSVRSTPSAAAGNSGASANLREEVAAYRKDLILRAACDAFFEHGYHECTVDMIAQRLSGSKAIVYYYFPDKHSILQEIYRRALAEAQALMRSASAEHTDPVEKLAAMARSYARWVIDNQRVVGIFWREVQSLSAEARSAVALEQKRMDDLLAVTLREGASKGVFEVVDVQTTARAIEGMITFAYTWWRDDKRLTRQDAAEQYAQMALRLVQARRS